MLGVQQNHNLGAELISELEQRFNDLQLQDLPAITGTFESATHKFLYRMVQETFFPTGKRLELTGKTCHIADGDTIFEVIVVAEPHDPSGLTLIIIERGQVAENDALISERIDSGSGGCYKYVQMNYPSRFSERQNVFRRNLQNFLDSSNRWLTEALSDAVFDFESKLSRRLYRYLRAAVGSSELVNCMWLSTVTKNNAHYILDSQASKSTLSRLASTNLNFGITPTSAMAHFLNCHVPIDDTFGLEVAKTGIAVDAKFADSRYINSLSDLSRAQAVVFGPESMTLYSLFREDGKPFLNCTFPSSHRSEIEPILDAHKQNIAKLFKDSISEVSGIYARLGKAGSRLDYSSFGEFIGGLAMGAAKSI